MTTYSYFILRTSDEGIEKRFRVVLSGYANVLEKAQNIGRTIDGQLDISVGSVQQKYMFMVRVRETETEESHGTTADLEMFYRLNNPNGTPSNLITFTNHLGQESIVVMIGDFNSQLQGVMIEGDTAWSIVNCIFQVVSLVPGGS
jgi:hypothetical protein